MSRLQIIFCFSIYFPPRIFLGRFFVAPDNRETPIYAPFPPLAATGGYSKLMSFEYVHVLSALYYFCLLYTSALFDGMENDTVEFAITDINGNTVTKANATGLGKTLANEMCIRDRL